MRDHYDLAILDCPPSISLASESVFGAADTLLVPVVPATLASRTLGQLTAFLDDQLDAPSVAPFLSMVDRRRRLHRELVDSLGSDWPELLATAVPAAAVIERMGTERAPLGVYAPNTPATRALPAAVDRGGHRPLGCRLGAGSRAGRRGGGPRRPARRDRARGGRAPRRRPRCAASPGAP